MENLNHLESLDIVIGGENIKIEVGDTVTFTKPDPVSYTVGSITTIDGKKIVKFYHMEDNNKMENSMSEDQIRDAIKNKFLFIKK